MKVAMWCIAIAVILMALLAAWRFFTQRSRGTVVVMRKLPASGTHGWRHGTLRYEGDNLSYFKLRSISPAADVVFNRLHMIFEGTRDLDSREQGFIDSSYRVAQVNTDAGHYELALSPHGLTAMTAWLEAAPDIRAERVDPRQLRAHFRDE